MISRDITVKNFVGLESRSAAMFIQKASNYKSNIWIGREEKKANAKSLLGVLSLGIGSGTVVTIVAEGEDEEKALDELGNFLGAAADKQV